MACEQNKREKESERERKTHTHTHTHTHTDTQRETETVRERGRKEMFLFNDALNTFYTWLYGVRHMVKDHSDSERGNLLLPHRLLFPISSKGSFICIIP